LFFVYYQIYNCFLAYFLLTTCIQDGIQKVAKLRQQMVHAPQKGALVMHVCPTHRQKKPRRSEVF
jgi:hypothetical protein